MFPEYAWTLSQCAEPPAFSKCFCTIVHSSVFCAYKNQMGAIFLIHDPKVEAAKAGDQAREWGSRKSGGRIVDSVKGGGRVGREREKREITHAFTFPPSLPPSPLFRKKGEEEG